MKGGIYVHWNQLNVPNIVPAYYVEVTDTSGVTHNTSDVLPKNMSSIDRSIFTNAATITKFEIGYLDGNKKFTAFPFCTNLQEQGSGLTVEYGGVFEAAGSVIDSVTCTRMEK